MKAQKGLERKEREEEERLRAARISVSRPGEPVIAEKATLGTASRSHCQRLSQQEMGSGGLCRRVDGDCTSR